MIGDTAIIPEDMEDALPDSIKAWLLNAIATEAENRFSNIEDMQKAFTKTAEDDKPAVEDKAPKYSRNRSNFCRALCPARCPISTER